MTPFHSWINHTIKSASNTLSRPSTCGAGVSLPFPGGRTPFQVFHARMSDRWPQPQFGLYNDIEDEKQALKLFVTMGASVSTVTPSKEPMVVYYLRNLYSLPHCVLDKALTEALRRNAPLSQVTRTTTTKHCC